MQQKNLFRSTDHDTSQEGAKHILRKLGPLQIDFIMRVEDFFERHQYWPTAQEVADGNESIRKRAAECVRAGAVGIGKSRRCRITGRPAQTYYLRGSK